jgi:hypothetical protein
MQIVTYVRVSTIRQKTKGNRPLTRSRHSKPISWRQRDTLLAESDRNCAGRCPGRWVGDALDAYRPTCDCVILLHSCNGDYAFWKIDQKNAEGYETVASATAQKIRLLPISWVHRCSRAISASDRRSYGSVTLWRRPRGLIESSEDLAQGASASIP